MNSSTKSTSNPPNPAPGAWRLRAILVYSLLVFAVLPAAIVGGLMYRSTIHNVDKLSNQIINDVAYRVQLDTENHLLQANSLLNGLLSANPTAEQIAHMKQLFGNPQEFETLSMYLTQMLPDVSFLYIGDTQGAFYGVQSIADDPEHRVKLHIKPANEQSRRYFSAIRPMDRSNELAPETKPYDPRQRPWYTSAVAQRKRVFTAVYPSASNGQLLITLAQPVFEPSGALLGVVGADLFLKALTKQLQAQKISPNGVAVLIDEQGALVATSAKEELFRPSGDQLIRLKPADSSSETLRETYAAYQAVLGNGGTSPQQFHTLAQHLQTSSGEKLISAVRPFGQSQGLQWTLMVAAPDSDFAGETRHSIQQSVYVTLAVLGLGAIAATLFAYILSKRFARLTQAAAELGRGEIPSIRRPSRIDEVRTLFGALHHSALEIKTKQQEIEGHAEALRQANENLEQRVKQRTRDLEESREAAFSAIKAKALFLATMSHEIRTPLNGVVGMADLLSDTVLSREQKDYVATMRVSSDQLLGVINNILDFSKIESGKLDLENEPLNIFSTIEQVFDMTASSAREKNIKLLVNVEDGVPEWVKGDITRLRQILLNYVNNAIKFTDKGQIVVSAHLKEDFVNGAPALIEFRVTDTGIGIPDGRQSALFQSFTQVDASTARRYGGSGLGLAICKRLTQAMGGEVGLQSTAGAGSSFWFTARLNYVDPQETSQAPFFQMISLRGKRVLIMDDTPLNLRILNKQVSRWGMETVQFELAKPALDWLAHNTVDMVVTDFHMPDMDGLEFAKALRIQQPSVAIVLLTSGMQPTGEMAANFNAILLKPYRQNQLFEALTRTASEDISPAQSNPTAITAQRGQSILVADDNPINLTVVVAMLTKLGYDSQTVKNGHEAVVLVAQSLTEPAKFKRFSAVLMDVNMPVLDGYAATQRIISAHGKAAPPIIALTASVLEEDRQRGLRAGMCGFLPKPLRIDELSSALTSLIQPADATPNSQPVSDLVQKFPESSLIDWERVHQLKEFDVDGVSLVSQLVGHLKRDSPGCIADLRKAIDNRDSKGLAAAAHVLRGGAANLGAVEVAQMCSELEAASVQSRWPSDIHDQVNSIALCLEQTCNQFDLYLH